MKRKFTSSSQKGRTRFYIIAEFQIFLLPFVSGQLENQELAQQTGAREGAQHL